MSFVNLIYTPLLQLIANYESKIIAANNDDSAKYDDIQNEISRYQNDYLNKTSNELLNVLEQPANKANLISAGVSQNDFEKGILLATLIVEIERDGNFNPTDACSIDPSLFQLIKHDFEELPFKVFGYQNRSNTIHSIVYFNLAEGWNAEITQSGLNPHLLAVFINKIYLSNDFPAVKKLLLIKNGPKNKAKNSALLKLHAIAHGKPVHQPALSQTPINVHGIDDISPELSYQQFNEILIILSEYVNQQEILFKYLSLYQVIENFMFRIPIAELTGKAKPDMFSIRKFKSLYNIVKDNESKTFTNRFQKYWSHNYDNNTLSTHVQNALTSLKQDASFKEVEFNKFLLNLESKETYLTLTGAIDHTKYAFLVYKLRCVIVHNNETEYHLSHFNINNTIRLTIDKFFIEVLEKLIFDLIIKKNNIIWYDNSTMKLFEAK